MLYVRRLQSSGLCWRWQRRRCATFSSSSSQSTSSTSQYIEPQRGEAQQAVCACAVPSRMLAHTSSPPSAHSAASTLLPQALIRCFLWTRSSCVLLACAPTVGAPPTSASWTVPMDARSGLGVLCVSLTKHRVCTCSCSWAFSTHRLLHISQHVKVASMYHRSVYPFFPSTPCLAYAAQSTPEH